MFSFARFRLVGLLFVLAAVLMVTLIKNEPVQAGFVRNEDNYWNMGSRPLPSDGNGEIKHCTLESNNLKLPNNSVGINVYTPPNYNNNSLDYPVIYLLHGLNGDEYNYLSYFSGSDLFNSNGSLPGLIDNGLTDEAIVVLVNGGAQSFYNDWSDSTDYGPSSNFPILSESVIMEDIIPFVDANFRTIDNRNGRAIEGFSMGGRGALKLAFNHPDQFCSTIAYAGAAYESIPGSAIGNPSIGPHEPANQISTIAEVKAADILANALQIRLVDGSGDGAAGQGGGSDNLSIQLDELGIAHEFEPSQIGVSSHNWAQYHQAAGAYGLEFHFQCFNNNAVATTIVTAVAKDETIDREPLPTKPSNPRFTTTPTSTLLPTSTSTLPPTSTATLSPTNTATLPPTSTATIQPTATATLFPTVTLSPTVTATLLPTFTATAQPTATATLFPTVTLSSTVTATLLPTFTATAQPTATTTLFPTATLSPTVTSTSLPTSTPTVQPMSTATLLPTSTVSSTVTSTPLPTATLTPTISATFTPTLIVSSVPVGFCN
ncbi:MAG: hypothetical protein H6652_05765 [Ardenticatenaceae bacterium]|nr:hypothetical protein [Ardenticatenaceae bacterium]